MTARTWPAAFDEIRRDFGFDPASDERSARWLAHLLSSPPYDPRPVLGLLRERCRGRTLWVLGAADSALEEVGRVPAGAPLFVADGAATAARETGRVPDAIVTDLDGHIPHEAELARRGAALVVHAHGDNLDRLQTTVPALPASRVAGTCQTEPPAPLLNPGGFTDGDRAVHLGLAFGAVEVRLLGFDFGHVGRYSGHRDPEAKLRKLAWARRLIEGLIASGAPVRYG